jgi:hypothetical protein
MQQSPRDSDSRSAGQEFDNFLWNPNVFIIAFRRVSNYTVPWNSLIQPTYELF